MYDVYFHILYIYFLERIIKNSICLPGGCSGLGHPRFCMKSVRRRPKPGGPFRPLPPAMVSYAGISKKKTLSLFGKKIVSQQFFTEFSCLFGDSLDQTSFFPGQFASKQTQCLFQMPVNDTFAHVPHIPPVSSTVPCVLLPSPGHATQSWITQLRVQIGQPSRWVSGPQFALCLANNTNCVFLLDTRGWGVEQKFDFGL